MDKFPWKPSGEFFFKSTFNFIYEVGKSWREQAPHFFGNAGFRLFRGIGINQNTSKAGLA